MEQVCMVCKMTFIPKHPKAVYCSVACRKKAENQRAKARSKTVHDVYPLTPSEAVKVPAPKRKLVPLNPEKVLARKRKEYAKAEQDHLSRQVIEKAIAPYKTAIVEKIVKHETGQLTGWTHTIKKGEILTDLDFIESPEIEKIFRNPEGNSIEQGKAIVIDTEIPVKGVTGEKYVGTGSLFDNKPIQESAYTKLVHRLYTLTTSDAPDRLALIELYRDVLDCTELTPTQRDFITKRIRSHK